MEEKEYNVRYCTVEKSNDIIYPFIQYGRKGI
jgi:hypothetical protein